MILKSIIYFSFKALDLLLLSKKSLHNSRSQIFTCFLLRILSLLKFLLGDIGFTMLLVCVVKQNESALHIYMCVCVCVCVCVYIPSFLDFLPI